MPSNQIQREKKIKSSLMFDHFVNGSVQERKKFHLVIIRENNKVITISLNPHPPPKKTDKNATHVHLIYEGDEFFFFFFYTRPFSQTKIFWCLVIEIHRFRKMGKCVRPRTFQGFSVRVCVRGTLSVCFT